MRVVGVVKGNTYAVASRVHTNADQAPPRHWNTYYVVCTESNLQQSEQLVANETNLDVFGLNYLTSFSIGAFTTGVGQGQLL